jgi:hypothetical protein
MIKGVDRREFLLGAAAASALPGANYLARAANAAEPSTNSSARLLVGCCALSYLRYFNAGTMTMEKFTVKCAEMGVQGVDVTTYWLASTEPE